MDFQQYRESIARGQSPRWTPRQKRLGALSRILGRKQYSHIRFAFSQERENSEMTGKRILLDNRRPSVQDPLAQELVGDLCSHIFGEGHRPLVVAKNDEPTTDWIAAFVEDSNFWITMMDALWKGSVGASFVLLRVLGKSREENGEDPETGETLTMRVPDGPGRYYFEVWPAEECEPVFDPQRPDECLKITRTQFLSESALAAWGYDVEALREEWDKKQRGWRRGANIGNKSGATVRQDWVRRIVLDDDKESWYKPVPRYVYERNDWNDSRWELDGDRSTQHALGEVPGCYIRPLPINADDEFPEGACVFEPLIDFQFRIDRTLSQVGRALDYSGDPQMAQLRAAGEKAPQSSFGDALAIGGTASDVVQSTPGGDVKFVEIMGDGLRVAIETYVTALEDIARKAGRMSRVTPNSKSGAAPDLSAAAMKMLNYMLLALCGICRATVAEQPGKRLFQLAMRMWKEYDVLLPSLEKKVDPNPDTALNWQWPDYYEPHGQEKLFEVQATSQAKEGGLISSETAIANTGQLFDVQNVEDEVDDIQTDQDTQLAQEVTRTKALAAAAPPTGPGVTK